MKHVHKLLSVLTKKKKSGLSYLERSVQLKQFDELCVILIEARFSFVAC